METITLIKGWRRKEEDERIASQRGRKFSNWQMDKMKQPPNSSI
ncbi:hypothetical protein JSO59_011155 [Riemerella anatipestifer]